MVALVESVAESYRKATPGPLVAVNRRRERDARERQKSLQHADRECGGLVHEHDVGMPPKLAVGRLLESDASARFRRDFRRWVVVGVREFVHRVEECGSADEHLAGAPVASGRHEHVLSLGSEASGGDSGGARFPPTPVGFDDDCALRFVKRLEGATLPKLGRRSDRPRWRRGGNRMLRLRTPRAKRLSASVPPTNRGAGFVSPSSSTVFRIHIHDGDTAVGTEEGDESPSEVSGYVLDCRTAAPRASHRSRPVGSATNRAAA